MEIHNYINSGILEAYLLGLASEEEQHEVAQMKMLYTEVSSALNELEVDIENYCLEGSVPPPSGTWELIEARTTRKDLKKRPRKNGHNHQNGAESKTEKPDYLEVAFSDTYIQVHKYWRIAFIAVFVLSKIFLITGLYYYFKADSQNQEIERLKTVIQQQAITR